MQINSYKYDNVNYINNCTKIEITCYNHGSFFQNPSDHLKGKGCHKCLYKNETACREAIEKITRKLIPKQKHKFLEGLEFDGYNEELKLAFEHSGMQHFKSLPFFGGDKILKQQQINDEKKLRLSKLNNITLIVVPYTVTNFEKYFEDYFYFM